MEPIAAFRPDPASGDAISSFKKSAALGFFLCLWAPKNTITFIESHFLWPYFSGTVHHDHMQWYLNAGRNAMFFYFYEVTHIIPLCFISAEWNPILFRTNFGVLIPKPCFPFLLLTAICKENDYVLSLNNQKNCHKDIFLIYIFLSLSSYLCSILRRFSHMTLFYA